MFTGTIFAGQTIDIGVLTLNYDGKFVFSAPTTGSWILHTVHIYIGTSRPPVTGAGNPQIGQFPYHFYDVDRNSFAVSIDHSVTCGSQVYVSFHAEARKLNSRGQMIQEETAFAYGEIAYSGSRWGWYTHYSTCCEGGSGCPECVSDLDCENPADVCKLPQCNSGVCGTKNNDNYVGSETTCGCSSPNGCENVFDSSLQCDDGDACTISFCSAETGKCKHTNVM